MDLNLLIKNTPKTERKVGKYENASYETFMTIVHASFLNYTSQTPEDRIKSANKCVAWGLVFA
jgi:hypothetical protein